MRIARTALIALVLLMAAGCGGSSPKGAHATYTPVPDASLFVQIKHLRGVERTRLVFENNLNYQGYNGEVWVRRGTDQLRTLDRVFAILWQGRPKAVIGSSLEVIAPGKPLVNALDLGLNSEADWVKRYGPQPGDGQPPS